MPPAGRARLLGSPAVLVMLASYQEHEHASRTGIDMLPVGTARASGPGIGESRP